MGITDIFGIDMGILGVVISATCFVLLILHIILLASKEAKETTEEDSEEEEQDEFVYQLRAVGRGLSVNAEVRRADYAVYLDEDAALSQKERFLKEVTKLSGPEPAIHPDFCRIEVVPIEVAGDEDEKEESK